jgi:hypothetical protein
MTTGPSRKERRNATRDQERRRAGEIDRVLEEPLAPRFEAPATGKIVDVPARPRPKKTP